MGAERLVGSEILTGPPSRSLHHNPKAAPAPELTVESAYGVRATTFISANVHFLQIRPGDAKQPSRNTSEEQHLCIPSPPRRAQTPHLPRKEKVNSPANLTAASLAMFSNPSHSQRGVSQLKPDLCLLRAQTRVRGPQASIIQKNTSSLSLPK